MHEHVNIHILLSLLWDCVHTAVCEKCIVRIEESVLLQVVLYRPTHLCLAHFILHKKSCIQFFLWCGKVGGCLERGGGEMVHVSGGRGLHGVSEGGGVI